MLNQTICRIFLALHQWDAELRRHINCYRQFTLCLAEEQVDSALKKTLSIENATCLVNFVSWYLAQYQLMLAQVRLVAVGLAAQTHGNTIRRSIQEAATLVNAPRPLGLCSFDLTLPIDFALSDDLCALDVCFPEPEPGQLDSLLLPFRPYWGEERYAQLVQLCEHDQPINCIGDFLAFIAMLRRNVALLEEIERSAHLLGEQLLALLQDALRQEREALADVLLTLRASHAELA